MSNCIRDIKTCGGDKSVTLYNEIIIRIIDKANNTTHVPIYILIQNATHNDKYHQQQTTRGNTYSCH